MQLTLRKYQQEAVDATFEYLNTQDGNPLIAMPTGVGKSIVVAGLIEQGIKTIAPGLRVLVLTHVKELIAQNLAKLLTLWPLAPAGVYSAGLNRRELQHQITFAGIASIHAVRESLGFYNLVIVDECHMISPRESTMYQSLFERLRVDNPNLRIVGLSATIFRMKLGLLTNSELFDGIAYDITGWQAFNELVRDGYLAPLVTKRTTAQLDVDNVRVSSATGDYDAHDLQLAVDQQSITRAACDEIEMLGADRKTWLVFAAGVQHAHHVCEELQHRGISCAVVHGALKRDERDKILQDLLAQRIRCVVNNNVLTTGFDCPHLDLIAVLRPTKSASLWVQMLGRGTRPSPGKDNCLVLDFAGNTARLGPVNDPVIPRAKNGKPGASPSVAPVRLCPECYCYCHITQRKCEQCGFEFPLKFTEPFNPTAGTDAVMRDESTIEKQDFNVDSIEFSPHEKDGRKSVCVTYYCGMRRFREWVAPDAASKGLSRKWLAARLRALPGWIEPEAIDYSAYTTAWLLDNAHTLPIPSSITVWLKKPYPQIIGASFNGHHGVGQTAKNEAAEFEDDDIPF